MINVFNDIDINKEFYENGFVKHGKIDNKAIETLINLSKSLDIPDFIGCDF